MAKESISIKDLDKELPKLAKKIDLEIKDRADAYFKNNTREANSLKDVIEIIKKHRGFIKVPFCSVEMDGEKCADLLKSKTEGVDVCGTLYPQEEKAKATQKCIICDKKANYIVYVAKSY